jgi:hypothetical protein
MFAVAVDQVVDEENSQDLANASMDVNISMIDLGNERMMNMKNLPVRSGYPTSSCSMYPLVDDR